VFGFKIIAAKLELNLSAAFTIYFVMQASRVRIKPLFSLSLFSHRTVIVVFNVASPHSKSHACLHSPNPLVPSQNAKQKAEKQHSEHLQRVSHTFSTHMQMKMIKNKLVKVELTSIITSTLLANSICLIVGISFLDENLIFCGVNDRNNLF
jgi:hypothetical protein